MTTNSESGHCALAKISISRDGFAEESDSEIDPQASSSQSEAITMEDATVSAILEDKKDCEKLQQIKESSFSKEIEKSGDDDVNKLGEVEQECIMPNGKESVNFEEKEQESEVQRLLEAEKRRLLAEIELGSIFKKRVDVDMLPKIEETMDNVVDKRSMKIELIDDTALVDVVTFYDKGNDHHPKRPGSAQNEKDAPRKHKKIGLKVVEGSESAKVSEFHNPGGENNGKQFRRLYSRKQLESMRFAHIVNQKNLWSEMYARLLPEVVTEYETLVCLKNHKTSKTKRVRGQTDSGIGNLDNLADALFVFYSLHLSPYYVLPVVG